MTRSKDRQDVELHRAILREYGHELGPDSMILDFGCGRGELVLEYRNVGLQAYGVDVRLPNPSEFLRQISQTEYRIPFDDETFDFIFSNSVLEHVQDLGSSLAELSRILKPGGTSLHIFPARAKPIEAHVFVPFGGLLRSRLWLLPWACLGIRNEYQKTLNRRQVIERNYEYLHNNTFYRSRMELRKLIESHFCRLAFADRLMIKHSYGRARFLFRFTEAVPFLAWLYGTFHNQCVFFEKPAEQS